MNRSPALSLEVDEDWVVLSLDQDEIERGEFLVVMEDGKSSVMGKKGIQIPGSQKIHLRRYQIKNCRRNAPLHLVQIIDDERKRHHISRTKVQKIYRLKNPRTDKK